MKNNNLCVSVSSFEESDFEILKCFVELNENMRDAALACKVISQNCKFPIDNASDILNNVFEGLESYGDLAGHSVTYDVAKKYLTPDFFPIENMGDLAANICIAFERKNTVASAERVIKSFKHLSSGSTNLEEQ